MGLVLEKCQPVRGGVKVGQYFLAPVARGAGEQYQRYARVKVISLKESSKVTAFLIDHSFTELMSVTRLRRMPDSQEEDDWLHRWDGSKDPLEQELCHQG